MKKKSPVKNSKKVYEHSTGKIVDAPKTKYRFNELKKVGRGLGSGKGAPRKIETAEKLWSLFLEYKEWSKANPYLIHQYTDRKGKDINQKRQRALTFIGFEGWLCMSEIIYDLTHYENATDYRPTILRIRKECSMDTISGALAGAFNANLASRIEGLSEKTQVEVADNRKKTADLFPEELDKD